MFDMLSLLKSTNHGQATPKYMLNFKAVSKSNGFILISNLHLRRHEHETCQNLCYHSEIQIHRCASKGNLNSVLLMLSVSEFLHIYGSAVPSHLILCISFRDCALQASTVSSTPWSTFLGSYKALNCLGQHLATTQHPMPTNTSHCFATFMGLLRLLVKNTKHPLLRHARLLATNPINLV